MNEYDKIDKLDPKSIEGIFVGYSSTSKAYRVYIKSSRIVYESVHVHFNETHKETEEGIQNVGTHEESQREEARESSPIVPTYFDVTLDIVEDQNHDIAQEVEEDEAPYQISEVLRAVTAHPLSNVVGDPREGVRTRSRIQNY